ncbi:MAG: DUF5602 domain-containing protein [Burkholderiales bacterium]|nr:DUF5602 domain-containing protein [Burkholderiales bacterium]
MNGRPAILLAAMTVGVLAADPAQADPNLLFGEKQKLGKGTVRTYVVTAADGKPTAIGISFTAGALEGLPATPNKTSRCFDLNKNGRIDDQGECEGDYELRLALPQSVAGKNELPFRWVGFNWNPHGHPPPPWSVAHFDMHFYMVDEAQIDAIRVGGCEIFIDCADRERALKPVPAQYVHPEHVSVGAAVGKMGNHLIDAKTPELAKENAKPFTHTWIYGAYDGQITFYEPMITRDYLLGKPNACMPIKQPKAWAQPGYYPTRYCIRYSEKHSNYTVSLEGLVHRQAQ